MTILDAINEVCKVDLVESAGVLHHHYWLNTNDRDNYYQEYINTINQVAQGMKDTE